MKSTLRYLRHNHTEETLTKDFEVWQPTISRIITTIETVLLHLLTPAVPSVLILCRRPPVPSSWTALIPTYNWHAPGTRRADRKMQDPYKRPPLTVSSSENKFSEYMPKGCARAEYTNTPPPLSKR
ncbi:transposase family protein [Rothia dentocariosa]